MEATFHAMRLARIGKIVALVRAGQPHAGFRAVIQHDTLGETKAQIALEKLPVGLHVNGKAVEVVEPAHIHSACWIALRLVLQRRT